ncbi:MAG: zinc ribbon domain-containing protein [Lentisphaerae bacterium]|nr:zinc ribbon domain-containing protein [Lentisphaerota bacterium]
MPTYEYECQKCGATLEKFQSIKDPPLKRCPKCRGKLRKVLGTGAGIIFKGSGFYQTDYRSKSYRDAAKSDSSKASASSSDSGTKSSGDSKKPSASSGGKEK